MMKRISVYVVVVMVLLACNKKTAEPVEQTSSISSVPAMVAAMDCAKQVITDQPVKVGETGIMLPIGTKLCFSADELEVKVELPAGYNFWVNRAMPPYATYTCSCSANGACKVFYAEGLGFGCLQSTCSGSCTGKFTYKGYTVEKVLSSRTEFFALPEVLAEIRKMGTTDAWKQVSLFGVSFFLVNDETAFVKAASCDCEGTAACKMKSIKLPFLPKIYFCDGTCNFCELTVS